EYGRGDAMDSFRDYGARPTHGGIKSWRWPRSTPRRWDYRALALGARAPRFAQVEFLLVLPVPASSYRDLDEFRHLEERVSQAIGETGRVDRHDAGAGETDFLILTQKPLEAYDALKGFGDFDARPELRAAYVRNDNDDYEVFQRDSTFRFHIA